MPWPTICVSGSMVARSRPAECPRWDTRGGCVAGTRPSRAFLFTLAMTLITGVVGLFVLLKQAEAERARLAEARRNAEAYEKFSATAADQLIVFLRSAFSTAQTTRPEQIKASLLELRRSIDELKSRGFVELSPFVGIFEEEVALALMQCGQRKKAEIY